MQGGREFNAHTRSLQELQLSAGSSNSTGDAVDVLGVRTAEELQIAVTRGFQYIELQNHVDLTTLGPLAIAATTGLSALLGSVPPEVWSIRVRL